MEEYETLDWVFNFRNHGKLHGPTKFPSRRPAPQGRTDCFEPG